MTEQAEKKEKASRWSTVRQRIYWRSRRAAEKAKDMELESRRGYIMDMMNDSEVLRRLSMQTDSATQLALQEFMKEMMETFAEINERDRPSSLKELRGIIKKTVHCDCEARPPPKPKNTVHFSEENVYFEIPRKRKKKFDIVTQKCTYYCCFGFLFPV